MNINVLRLRNILDDREKEIRDENTNFLEEINNELIDDDIFIEEGVENSCCTIVFVETGGSEPLFLESFDSIKDRPIILLANGKNNSLPASFEIKTYCSMHKVPALILTGTEAQCATIIKRFARVCNAKQSLCNNNLAVIGEPSDWLIASRVNYDLVKSKFDINVIQISMEELMAEIDKHEFVNRIPHLADLKKKFTDENVLNDALYIYSALKRLVAKYNLNGLTIRCFDLLGKYKNTACLGLALLNEEGITSACEGDVPALLTMHFLYALTGRPSFQANPSMIDQEKKEVLFAHCTLPLNMVSKYDLLTHFESNLGIGVKGQMPLGEVSICKVFMNENGDLGCSIAMPGTIKENLSLPGYCRTQILVSLSDFDMLNLFKEDFGNHMVITYTDVTNEFYTLLTFYDANALASKID